MRSIASLLFLLSRPRFWGYTLGPAILGATSVFFTHGFSYSTLILITYFSFPANLLIYGVNDVFDYETDRLNNKKQGYEHILAPESRNLFWKSVILFHLPFLPLFALLPSQALIAFGLFWLLAIAYSAPPLRLKSRPGLDSASNVLYLMPFFAVYFAGGGRSVQPLLLLAAGLWCMAMHAYSAVPDIASDRAAGLATIATWAGAKTTLWLCLLAYLASGVFAALVLGWPLFAFCIPYLFLIIISFSANTQDRLLKVYRLFPVVNMTMGFGLFILLLLRSW